MKKTKVAALILSATLLISPYISTGARNAQNATVINLTEDIGTKYNICPELIQAIIYYESSNNPDAYNGDCIGYMQVAKQWHRDRMQKLGVTDLTNGYSNILTGTDYLAELAAKYGDIGYVLMLYNGDSRAQEYHATGQLSEYAQNVLTLSAKLERIHEK
jgi:soluble lytic murein transglycosylase-like protein